MWISGVIRPTCIPLWRRSWTGPSRTSPPPPLLVQTPTGNTTVRDLANFCFQLLSSKFPCSAFMDYFYSFTSMFISTVVLQNLLQTMLSVLWIRIRSDPQQFGWVRIRIHGMPIRRRIRVHYFFEQNVKLNYTLFFSRKFQNTLSKILKIVTPMTQRRKIKQCRLALLWIKF